MEEKMLDLNVTVFLEKIIRVVVFNSHYILYACVRARTAYCIQYEYYMYVPHRPPMIDMFSYFNYIQYTTHAYVLVRVGLALFESGLLRAKNTLSIFVQIFGGVTVMSLLWVVFVSIYDSSPPTLYGVGL